MKKLMTMIAAVATAFGLFADEPTTYNGTSFETGEGGVTELKWTPASGVPAGTWSTNPTIEDALDLGAYATEDPAYPYASGEGATNTRRNDQFVNGDQNLNYLKLDTGSATVDRAVATAQVFFDQVIKFTGFEDMQTNFVENTKIALWTSAIEDDEDTEEANEADTNLYVAVGTGAVANPMKNVKVAVPANFDFNAWHRVTIKNAGPVSENYLGFFVWIDGVMAQVVEEDKGYFTGDEITAFKSYYEKGQLFISMDGDSTTVANIGFQGVGSLDDVVVSEENDGPAFAVLTVDVTFKEIPGAVIAEVKDADGVVKPSGDVYSVKPGDITVTLAPAAGYKMMKGTGVYKLKASAAGELTIPADEDAYALVAAIVVNNDVTNEFAETELYGMINGLVNGDEVEFKTDAAVTNVVDEEVVTLYSFPADSTIAVSVANDVTTWAVVVAGKGVYAYDYVGTTANFIKNYTFEDEFSSLVLNGDVAGAVSAANVYSMAEIEVSGTLTAESLTPSEYITISGEGKVVTMTGELTDWFLPEGEVEMKENTPAAGWYTYQLSTAPKGFMLLIGEAAPVTYPTLEEAVAAVGATTDPVTIKFYENAVLTARVDVAKNMTLDLNGNNISMAGDTAKVAQLIKVINGATLTINGTNSTVTGLICVGRKLTNQPVENAALVINGGTYQVGDNTAIHVQGDCTAAAVTINDATIISESDNGIQFNGKGTYAINNSSVTGYTAIYVKGGTLAIDGKSEITANGATRITPTPNGNGSNKTGDAIVLDTHSSYQGDISLTLAEGAKVNSTAGAAILETVTLGSASATMSIADNGAVVDAPIGLEVSPKFAERVAAGLATVTGYIATVDGIGYKDVATALAAVQAKEVGDNYTIQVVILADNTEISNGAQVIVLNAGDAITITKGSWVFNNGVTITGAIALAEGASITVKTQIPNYEQVITAPDGFKVIEVAGTGVYTYTTEALPTIPWDGEGTEDDPWQLDDAQAFVDLKTWVEGEKSADVAGKYFIVTGDDIALGTAAAGWEGIGTSSKQFTGKLNGNGKTLAITLARCEYNGLFRFFSDTTVSNMTVTLNGFATEGDASFGGAAIVGKFTNSRFENITVNGELSGATHNIAGIAVRDNAAGTTEFIGCVNNATLSSSYTKIGGIMAMSNFQGSTIRFIRCQNNGTITNSSTGDGGLAGITAYNEKYALYCESCTNTAQIVKTAEGGTVHIGSLLGVSSNNGGAKFTLAGDNVSVDNLIPVKNTTAILNWGESIGNGLVKFVTPETSVSGTVALKVMNAANTAFTLTDAAASLALDTTVAAYTGTVSVDPALDHYELKTETTGNVTTYTVAAIPQFDVKFTKDGTEIPESAKKFYRDYVIAAGDIPTITDDGEWDVQPVGAVITSNTNFNFTVKKGGVTPEKEPETPEGKANLAKLNEVLGAKAAEWQTAVYGGAAVPVAALEASTPELIEAAAAYNLKVMADPVTITPEAVEGGFTFTLKDDLGVNPVVAASKVQEMMAYTSDLKVNFARDAAQKAIKAEYAGGAIKVEFTYKDLESQDANAGFMKVDLSVAK